MMNDQQLLAAFESCTLPSEQWDHRAHVRIAYLYASQLGLRDAIDRIRIGIKAYNRATDTPEAIDRGYHETMTLAFTTLVFAANYSGGPYESSVAFCDAHPELLDKHALRSHYTRERIMTWEAKAAFVDPDLRPLVESKDQALCESSPCDPYDVVGQLSEEQVAELYEMMQQQWWGGKRSFEDVKTMVQHTSLMVGLVCRSNGKLVGYARVLTDFVFRATIYDVMVDRELRERGLGARLLGVLRDHPKLQAVNFIYLACEPKLFSFYQRCGYKVYDGRAKWMIKVQREEV